MNTILQADALLRQHHAGAGEIALIAQLGRWDPDGRKRPRPLEAVQTAHVEPVGLVDHAHHQFGLSSVNEVWRHARRLNFVDDPIPVAHGFDRDGRPRFALGPEIVG